MSRVAIAEHAPDPMLATQPTNDFICWRDCAHIRCLHVRHQWSLACEVCGDPPVPGEAIYILERGDLNRVTKLAHKACFEAQR